MSDEELEHMARSAGLLEVIDDAYIARGNWLPEAREFASLVQSAERERCAQYLRDSAARLAPEGKRINQIIRLRRDARATAADLIEWFCAWEKDARIFDNVRAGDAVNALKNLLESAEEQSHSVLMVQTKKLYADAIEFAQLSRRLLNENEKLRAFAQAIMEAWPEGGIEGDDLQEIEVKNGMLSPETRFEPCGEWCQCNGIGGYDSDDWQLGVNCYRRTALLTGQAE